MVDAEAIKKVIAEKLEVDIKKLVPEADFIQDLGADSLDIVELIMALEEEFGLQIPDSDAETLKSVGEAIKYIQENAKG
ncbi:MAG: acyl carrier protein [Candidatus Coatesbacteria bacterium]|nr:acyl carrier protein [Candidatus Coatesbacteria bacterium]